MTRRLQKLSTLAPYLSIVALAISFFSLPSTARAQQDAPATETILEDWPLGSPVNSFFGHRFEYPVRMTMRSGPVRVSCVRTGIAPYYDIDQVRIENGTAKPLVKLKLSWTLSMEGPPNTILESWDTDLMDVAEVLPGGPRLELSRLRFKKALESPVDERSGSWMIVEVSVDEVVYKDGTRWKRK
jgi:hypothetical protein